MTDTGRDDLRSTESVSRTWRLARKELREILRDRRTVLTLVLMPLLVYPLLGVIMRKGVLSNLSLLQKIEVRVCLESASDSAVFTTAMLRGQKLLLENEKAGVSPTLPSYASSTSLNLNGEQEFDFATYELNPMEGSRSLEGEVRDGYADVAVKLSESSGGPPGGIQFLTWTIYQQDGSALSQRGFREIKKRLDAFNERFSERLLRSNGLPTAKPATIASQIVSSGETGVSPLITFIPLVLVLMTMTGAVYPAIDLTAGERERGTMEILVAAPVSRMTLLAGKFVAVLTVALLTASMNLISMFATLFALGMEGTVLGNVGPAMIFQVVVLMVVFAAFFSAVLLSITSVARSFKEAQAYLVPLMLISLTPGVFSLMPNLEMNGLLAVTPLVNTVLMGRDLLQGNVNILMFAIVLISTALYGVLALALAARIFGSDAVLYGSGGTWADLLKRPQEESSQASVAAAMSCLAIVFFLFIVLGSVPSRLDTTLTNQLLASGLVSALIFIVVPFIVARIWRVKPVSGFALRSPHWSMWLVAVLLGGSVWSFVYEIEISMLSAARVEELEQLFAKLKLDLNAVPLWVKLLSLAAAPAICEEFFFRGFLQTAIRKKSSAVVAILSAGVLFGLFHVIVKDALLFERLVPSALLGILLGIVFERSGSVFPGMLLHFIHNGFLLTVSEYETQISEFGIGISDRQHLPTMWLVCTAVPVVIAFAILFTRKSSGITATSNSETH